jgi:transglutaminase-like putative cysteine protease
MSTGTSTNTDGADGAGAVRGALARLWTARAFALLGAVGLLFSFLSVLYSLVTVTGDPTVFLGLVAVSLVAAAVVSRLLRLFAVSLIAGVSLAVGLAIYLSSLPNDPAVVALLASNVELLTGRSLLRIEQTTIWVLSVTPAPTFVTAYLALRRRYVGAAMVGGLALGYFILTGDAGTTVSLIGVVSAGALIGFGDLDGEDTDRARGAVQAVTVVLALMVLAPAAIPAVPAGGGGPLSIGGGGGTVEASLLSTDAQFEIAGDISLSPEVRYTVTSGAGSYWRVGSYNRYTGDGWVRTGENTPYEGRLDGPPGPSVTVTQQYEVESDTEVMPAAWRPISVSDSAAPRTRVTGDGGLVPTEGFEAGDVYAVTSEFPQATPARLAEAGTEYPDRIAERYTQLPANTPDRVAERTSRLTARADNPYETARVIEQWLEENREYSLDVDRAPSGNVADAFLFEMERGYCTYYATTMATMLRTQGIPARVAVGYTAGQQVSEDTWVVRGFDSHTWVEVYFPETGWVRFDPTPAGPRRAAEQQRLEQARQGNETNVDTSESEPTPTPLPTPQENVTTPPGANTSPEGNVTPSVTVTGNIRGDGQAGGDGGSGFRLPELPSREQVMLGAVVFAGAVAGLRRTGLNRRLSWWLRARVGPPDEPAAAIEWTYDRLAFRLERRHRPRRSDETMRAYLEAIDADTRARRIATLRERARYGGEATEEMAAEATRLFEQLRRNSG